MYTQVLFLDSLLGLFNKDTNILGDHDSRSHRSSSRRDREREVSDRRHRTDDRYRGSERAGDRHSSHRSHNENRHETSYRNRRHSPVRERTSRRESHRSRSPVRRRPDISFNEPEKDDSITPLHLRERKINNWDVPPPGYEDLSAEQAKATGHFLLPSHIGALKTAGILPPNSAGSMYQPFSTNFDSKSGNTTNDTGINIPAMAKQAKRIYAGNIPYGISEYEIGEFFNHTLKTLKQASGDGNPVLSVQINLEKNYAFVDFTSVEEASAAMAFDGIPLRGHALKIRRPKDYQPIPAGSGYSLNANGTGGLGESQNKIFIGGIPTQLNEDQIVELLKSFGELKSFRLVRDVVTGISKGYAFCEFEDNSVTDIVCEGLNQMELGDKKLIVQRASIGAHKSNISASAASSHPTAAVLAAGPSAIDPMPVLLLLNMVTADELVDDEEYEDLLLDIKEECDKYGEIKSIKIPRQKDGYDLSVVGKIYVQYQNKQQASKAMRNLAGRKFSDRTVLVSFYSENKFNSNLL